MIETKYFKKLTKMLAKGIFLCYICKAKGLYEMEEVEKTIYFGNLLELYGKLLSPVQEKFLREYYENDLTLSEIAENNGVSRQAVYDAIVKAQSKLLEFEEKVGAHKEISRLKGKKDGNF